MEQKPQTILQKFFSWIVYSSANGDQVSLTVRGVLVGAIPTIMVVIGIAQWNVGQDELTLLFDKLAEIVQMFFAIVAAVMAVIGLARKIWKSVFGSNDAINKGYLI